MIQNPAIQGGGGVETATVKLTGPGTMPIICAPFGETEIKRIYEGSFIVSIPAMVVSGHHPVRGNLSVSGNAQIFGDKYVYVYGDCSIYMD